MYRLTNYLPLNTEGADSLVTPKFYYTSFFKNAILRN